MKYRCPICHKPVKAPSRKRPEQTKFFPFCSERCKLIDLGAWLDAKYQIVSEFHSQPPESELNISMEGPTDNNK